jgi:BMFP domain-containing protein YqiC
MSDNFKSSRINTPAKTIMQQLLISALNKLNLVTRQEFATQTQVLQKTRLRIEQLEKKILELEGQKPPS